MTLRYNYLYLCLFSLLTESAWRAGPIACISICQMHTVGGSKILLKLINKWEQSAWEAKQTHAERHNALTHDVAPPEERCCGPLGELQHIPGKGETRRTGLDTHPLQTRRAKQLKGKEHTSVIYEPDSAPFHCADTVNETHADPCVGNKNPEKIKKVHEWPKSLRALD